jgi:hypothetical protein
MRRCLLIGAVRQAAVWTHALQAAASSSGEDLVFLEYQPSYAEPGDESRIFVSCDARHFVPAEDADRIAVLDGFDRFAGFDEMSEDQARIHLIEVSRQAVEALCWAEPGRILTPAMADAGRCGEALSVFGLSISPPHLDPFGISPRDLRANEAIAYLINELGETYWSPHHFIFDRHLLQVDENGANLDITGPPRALLRGPYFWAPKGRWKITAQFSIDADGARHEFQFRWGAPLTPTILQTIPEKAGMYEVELEADWEEIDGMEFTIALVHGCVSGELVFLGAKISNVPPADISIALEQLSHDFVSR